jgi:hypothetical protein
MKYTSKMILVPSDIGRDTRPVDETLNNLDSGMMKIIQDKNLPIDIKWKMYSQLLQRFRSLQNSRNKPIEIEVKSDKLVSIEDSDILEGVPEKKIHQARLLLDFIHKQHNIEIEENGELTINGNREYGSNIIDLIHDFVRERKTNLVPVGGKVLAKTLKSANMPLEYIGNKNRLELFATVQSPQRATVTGRTATRWIE